MPSGMAGTVGVPRRKQSRRSTRRGLLALGLVLLVGMSALSGVGGMVGAASATNHPTIDSCGRTIDSSGIYHLDSDLSSSGSGPCIEVTSSQVTIEGNGHEISGPPGVTGMYVHGQTGSLLNGVAVENLDVVGFDHGVHAEEVGYVRFESVNVSGTARHGYFMDNVHGGEGPALIIDSSVQDAGEHGILLAEAARVSVRGTVVNETNKNGIHAFASDGRIQDVTVANASKVGIMVPSSSSASITGSTVRDSDGPGIRVENAGPVTLTDNTVLGNNRGTVPTGAGIHVEGTTGVSIEDQVVRNNRMAGIRLNDADQTTIRDSRITENCGGQFGISVADSADVHVVNSNVSNNTGIGMQVFRTSPNVLVEDTKFNHNGGFAGYQGEPGNVLDNVTANHNAGDGIITAKDAVLRDVEARNNDQSGLQVSTNVTLNGGVVSANGRDDVAVQELTATDLTVAGNEFSEFDAQSVDVNGVVPPHPDAPSNLSYVGRNVSISNANADSYVDVEVGYSDAAVSGLNESTLSLYRHDGNWHDLGGAVDAGANTFSANVTEFGRLSLIAAEAEPSSSGSGSSTGGSGSNGGGGGEPPGTPSINVTAATLSATEIEPGDSVTVETTLENDGDGDGTTSVSLHVDGEGVTSKKVLVRANGTSTIHFSYTPDEAGEYELVVANRTAGTVTAAEQSTATPGDGGGSTTATQTPTATPTLTEAPAATETPDDGGGGAPTPEDTGGGGLGPFVIVALVAVIAGIAGAGFLVLRPEG